MDFKCAIAPVLGYYDQAQLPLAINRSKLIQGQCQYTAERIIQPLTDVFKLARLTHRGGDVENTRQIVWYLLLLLFKSLTPPFTGDRMEGVVEHAAQAIDSVAETPNLKVVWGVLHILSQLKGRFEVLAEQAYGWCLMIWRNRDSYEDWETHVLLSLEVGLRHYRSSNWRHLPPFAGGELHQGVYDTVFKSNDTEAVTDLVSASLMFDRTGGLGFSICVDYIIDRRGRVTDPSSQHLRPFFTEYVARMGSNIFEKVGKERLAEVLNGLHIGIEEADYRECRLWVGTLVEVIQFAEARCLALHCWKFLADFAATGDWRLTYNPDITTSLMDAREWDKLECWVDIVWMARPPETGDVAKDLEDAMEALEKERPGALRKRVERRSEGHRWNLPAFFQLTCAKLALLAEPPNEGPSDLSPPTQSTARARGYRVLGIAVVDIDAGTFSV